MRFYAFTNFYLSSMQKGIQAQHCTAELFVHYNHRSKGGQVLYNWAQNHKTTIVLNGGNCADLHVLYLQLRAICDELGYPYQSFSEDAASLNGAITCVGVVLPERIYNGAQLVRDGTSASPTIIGGDTYMVGDFVFTWPEYQLIVILNKHSLAS